MRLAGAYGTIHQIAQSLYIFDEIGWSVIGDANGAILAVSSFGFSVTQRAEVASSSASKRFG